MRHDVILYLPDETWGNFIFNQVLSHDITEILLKKSLNTKTLYLPEVRSDVILPEET